ncbi:MAG TPA: prepilin-type N-terminal cleavage/methylation domain-containing protein [Candidatus Hydrogenedentes bacterium]|nr:prepilin-type N-terminal cleavage/methylation domain-containing protein [Candidatus Hydrogenedentota bacterium]
MSTPHRNRLHYESGAKGFTLIELLVSMAIFVTIMSGVTLMFNSAVRVTKQAYLNQAAFETVRGTFDTIEHDLTRSFVSRESGHKHTFYGTPIGFTFIGLVSTDGTDEYNLARITYVMYSDPFSVGLTKIYESTADDTNASAPRITYTLLRYIEPGVEDLESFPIEWTSPFQGDSPNLTLAQEVTLARSEAVAENLCLSNDNDDPCIEEVEKSKRRELWIRMLAGDPSLPHFWDNPNNAPTVRTTNISGLTRDPADYVIAENILHIERNRRFQNDETGLAENLKGFDPDNSETFVPTDTAPFGQFENVFIDPDGLDLAIIESLDESHVDYLNTDAGKIRARLDLDGIAAFTHQNYFFAYREYAETGRTDEDIVGLDKNVYKVDAFGELLDGNGTSGVILQENELVASLFSFWNDTRNLEHNTVLSAANIGINNNLPQVDQELVEDIISTQPDILDPTLPESIMIQLAFFYPSPYPGAPDFEKIFTHSINLPTAYKRKQETLWTKQVRN